MVQVVPPRKTGMKVSWLLSSHAKVAVNLIMIHVGCLSLLFLEKISFLKVLYVFELKKLVLTGNSRKEKVSGLHITVVENNFSLAAIAFYKLCTLFKRDKSYCLELIKFE